MKEKKCPKCHKILRKSYHIGFKAPVLLICKCGYLCKTKEIAHISISDLAKVLKKEEEKLRYDEDAGGYVQDY